VPVEEVDEVVVLKPNQCSSCHAALSGDDASPFRHQVIEIPPIKPVITEESREMLGVASKLR